MFLQEDKLEIAVELLKNDQIVGIPTETVYGIGVNPFSHAAVENLFKIKERDDTKPLSLLIHSFSEFINST